MQFIRRREKKVEEPVRPQLTILRMRTVRSVTKATNTYSEYVTITAFLLQQRLHERPSVLRFTRYMYYNGSHTNVFWNKVPFLKQINLVRVFAPTFALHIL